MTEVSPVAAAGGGRIRDYLMQRVVEGVSTVAAFQRACGVVNGVPTNRFLDRLFRIGAATGNELFFILFLPALFWCYDLTVARMTILVWCFSFYIGHVLKDAMRLPRPFLFPPPPNSPGGGVSQLEPHYSWEFGWPSTHASNALSMPTLLTIWSWDRVTPAARVGLLVMTFLWFSLCVGSRMYLGVHTPVDIRYGIAIGSVMILFGLTLAPRLDEWLLDNPWSPLATVVGLWTLMALYPKPKSPKWLNSPGDTILILSCSASVYAGCHFTAAAHYTSVHLPIDAHPFTSPFAFLSAIGRIFVGFTVVGGVRAILKEVGMRLFVALRGTAYAPDDDLSVVAGLASPTASASGPAPSKALSASAFAVNSSKSVASIAGGRSEDAPAPAPGADGLRKRGAKGDAASSSSSFLEKPTLSLQESSASSGSEPDTLGLPLTPLGTPREPAAGVKGFKGVPPPPIDTSAPADAVAASLKNEAERAALAAARQGAPPGMVRVAPGRRYDIELPVKFITYWGVGLASSYIMPNLFNDWGWRKYHGMSW